MNMLAFISDDASISLRKFDWAGPSAQAGHSGASRSDEPGISREQSLDSGFALTRALE
jgi:hypothetical protein